MKNRLIISTFLMYFFTTTEAQWNGTNPVWTNSAVKIGNFYEKRIDLPAPGPNAGNGKWYIRLHSSSVSNIACVKITVQGSWNYSGIFGWLTGEYTWYCPGDNTITNSDFRITSTTGRAFENLRLGEAVIESGYISIPVWCVNTNSPKVTVEWYDTSDIIIGTLTSTSWISETLPAQNYQSIKSNLHVEGKLGIGTMNPASNLEIYPNSGSNPSFTRINLDVSADLFPKVYLGAGLSGGYIGYDEAGYERMVLSSYDPSSHFEFLIGLSEKMRLTSNGNLLIAKTSQTNTNYKLDVNGKIRADEVVVNTTGADFVFEKNYKLLDLSEVEKFITENKRLPGIKSALEMEKDGISISELQIKMLQKIEELTIYVIKQNKKIESLEQKIQELSKEQRK